MSVINDMLRDLDRRDGQRPPLAAGTIRVVTPARELPWRWLVLLAAAVAVAAGTYRLVEPRVRFVAPDADAIVAPVVEPVAAQISPVTSAEPNAVREEPDTASVAPTSTTPAVKVVESTAPTSSAPEPDTAAPLVSEQVRAIAAPAPLHKQPSQTLEALADAAYSDGMVAMRGAQHADAERAFANALSLQPTHRDALVALAQLHIEAARFDVAEALLVPALVADDAPVLRQLLARAQWQRGRAGEALQTLRAAQPPMRDHRDYYATQAALEQQLGDHRAAADHYAALVGVDPTQATWWLGLALAHESLRSPDAARDAYRRALVLNTLPAAARDFAQQRLLATHE